MIDLISSPIPSLTSLSRLLYKYVSTHPLVINPPIFHPITKKRVLIDRYKLFNGVELQEGLTCSIYPHYQDPPTPPDPSSKNVSALYMPHNLGPDGNDHAVFHLCIKFHFASLILGNKSEDKNLITVPSEAVTHPSQILLTSRSTKELDLYINPGSDIIGDYLELIRLVIEDPIHRSIYQPLTEVDSIELIFVNLRALPWEKKREIYFHEGEALIRIDSYVSRGWRNRFLSQVKEINLDVGEQRKQVLERKEIC
jgi:hypothetical protein